MAGRTLIIMRHADAEPPTPGRPDVARELTAAGRRRAASRTGLLAVEPPDLVLCSAAVRAQQTLALLDLSGTRVEVEEQLYTTSAMGALQRISQVSDAVGTLLYLGHMPTVGELLHGLVSGAPDIGFPPAGAAVLDLPEPWSALHPATATLRQFVR